MATGKTTIGNALAEHFALEFVDTDELIERKHAKKIANIFADYGEKFFREQESICLKAVCRKKFQVIATGGGVVLREENIKNLLSGAHVICLTATAETVLARTQGKIDRPLLQVIDPLAKIKEMIEIRRQYYEMAEYTIHTDDRELTDIVCEIEVFLQKMGWERPKQHE